jgi:hypothetical protein
MLSFAQFLAERFLKGVHGFGYAEIWKDPKYLEILKLAYEANRNNDSSSINRLGTGTKNIDLGGLIHDDHLYLWDRGQATHSTVWHNIPHKGDSVECIYLRFDPRTKAATVRIAEYSQGEMGDAQFGSNNELVRYCRKLKPFKIFSRVAVDNESDSY